MKLKDRNVTREEFREYYQAVSSSIDDDAYFELMMTNAWNFNNVSYNKGWGSDQTEGAKSNRKFR